jgi:hypothetical protein
MKTNYLLILLVCFSQILLAQTMKIYKTDQTTLSFTLSDIDSMKISTSANGSMVSSSNWTCFTNSSTQSIIEPSTGIYEKVEDGLKVYGSASNSNNTIQLMPVSQNSIMSKTIYLKWKVNGNGNDVNVRVELFTESANLISAGRVLDLSTKQMVSGSTLIADDIWYYTRISVASGNVTSVTAIGNYDNSDGKVISNSSLKINKDIETFSFQTKTDKTSYTILAESRIE